MVTFTQFSGLDLMFWAHLNLFGLCGFHLAIKNRTRVCREADRDHPFQAASVRMLGVHQGLNGYVYT